MNREGAERRKQDGRARAKRIDDHFQRRDQKVAQFKKRLNDGKEFLRKTNRERDQANTEHALSTKKERKQGIQKRKDFISQRRQEVVDFYSKYRDLYETQIHELEEEAKQLELEEVQLIQRLQ